MMDYLNLVGSVPEHQTKLKLLKSAQSYFRMVMVFQKLHNPLEVPAN